VAIASSPGSHPDLIAELLVARASEFEKGRTWRVIKPLLGEGLFTSEGELHKRQRRLCCTRLPAT